MNNILHRSNRALDKAEETVSELEDIAIRTIQNERVFFFFLEESKNLLEHP
jgi:hypothetical protein